MTITQLEFEEIEKFIRSEKGNFSLNFKNSILKITNYNLLYLQSKSNNWIYYTFDFNNYIKYINFTKEQLILKFEEVNLINL